MPVSPCVEFSVIITTNVFIKLAFYLLNFICMVGIRLMVKEVYRSTANVRIRQEMEPGDIADIRARFLHSGNVSRLENRLVIALAYQLPYLVYTVLFEIYDIF